jgi:hypothetical protein
MKNASLFFIGKDFKVSDLLLESNLKKYEINFNSIYPIHSRLQSEYFRLLIDLGL